MTTTKTALVLGATGGIGGEVARQLRNAGWTVRALNRSVRDEGPGANGLHWIRGDAMDRAAVVKAAQGASIIVHAVNPPGYRRWAELVLPMIDNTIAAAAESDARIVLPGTVYNYGPDAFPAPHEDSPQHPQTRKGAIRVEMESRLRKAAARGVRTLVVRAGDYFGPRAANNWFTGVLVKPGAEVKSIGYPGRAGTGHQWAYLPDVARTMVRLIEIEDRLEPFATFHMEGHWDADGTAMLRAIQRALGDGDRKPAPPVSAFPWWAVLLASLFVPFFRELREMRYLWQQPVRMGNERLVATLGSEPHTNLDEAVRETLASMGVLRAYTPEPATASA